MQEMGERASTQAMLAGVPGQSLFTDKPTFILSLEGVLVVRSRTEIKAQAREALHAQYGTALVISIVFSLLIAALGGASFGVAALILSGPLTIAITWGMLALWRAQPTGLSDCFSHGSDNVGRKIGGYLWMMLWLFLWSLLFAIPAIVKSYSYAMTPYILADMPDVPAKDALRLSMRMMDGHKLDLFVMDLSFFGWILLSALTGGILLVLYVEPYMSIAKAGFYDELKQESIRNGLLIPAL